MRAIFTVCSNNYLAQAAVLGNSLREHAPGAELFLALVDVLNETVDYSQFPFTVITIREIEPGIDLLAEKYNILELNACLKPQVFLYLFERYDFSELIFLDTDMVAYDSFELFGQLFRSHDILLTPHILTPMPNDNKSPDEQFFLTYGLYNAGFAGVKRSEEGIKFLHWWKNHNYTNGFNKVETGTFADQLCLNHAPVLFKNVCIIDDPGCNMAQWNLHERWLTNENGVYLVNSSATLKFFHFSGFQLNSSELSVHFYSRFSMKDRPDLLNLYAAYNKSVVKAGFSNFDKIDCYYYERFIDKKMADIELAEQKRWTEKPFVKRLFYKTVPASLIKSLLARLQKIDNGYPYAKYK